MRNPAIPMTKDEIMTRLMGMADENIATQVSGDMTSSLLRAAAAIVRKQEFIEFDPAQWN